MMALNPENPQPAAEGSSAPAPDNHIGPFAYVIAMMSVMPGLGIILGPIAVVWGLSARKRGGKPVAIIGALGFGSQSLFFVFLVHKLLG
jgi:hypothetical protein